MVNCKLHVLLPPPDVCKAFIMTCTDLCTLAQPLSCDYVLSPNISLYSPTAVTASYVLTQHTAVLQDSQLQAQLESLETRLQGLTGEDKEALEEESRQCTQLIDTLYRQAHQSAPSSVAEPVHTGGQSPAGGQLHPAVTSSSHQQTPLLLGPPL